MTEDKYRHQKKYYKNHQEELRAKRKAKYRQAVDARLVALITDYVEGCTIKELQDKYKVGVRKVER